MPVSGIILAGGYSSRMGCDKSLLLFKSETLIERAVRKMRSVADEIIIASNDTEKYNLPGTVEVPDIFPDMGPLGGIHAGLMAASYPYSFVISCDLPFFEPQMAEYLLSRKKGYDVVVPEIQKHVEPVCAVYASRCLTPMEFCLAAGMNRIYKFYADVRVLHVNEYDLQPWGDLKKIFFNLNTPEDAACLRKQCR